MKRFFSMLVLACLCCAGATAAQTEEQQNGVELCHFAEKVFTVLHDANHNASELSSYQKSRIADIQALANEVIGSKGGEELGEAVSQLGRLIKTSADSSDASFALDRSQLQAVIRQMGNSLGVERPVRGTNYHKLMIESMADERYDLALYSYMMIAESRCIATHS